MTKNDGGPAFATGNREQGGNEGMSLRDWFAGQALAGFLATVQISLSREDVKDIAKSAYKFSDAMIAERDKQ